MGNNHQASCGERVSVLIVSSLPGDREHLRNILARTDWNLYPCTNRREAKGIAFRFRAQVAICDRELPDGTWRDLFADFAPLDVRPNLIIASSDPDPMLWAEAFNLGAYDVLAKPFHSDEVIHVVRFAWLNWRDRERLRLPHRTAAGQA